MTRQLNIAIVGSRGIPGNYGGFETFAEHLSAGLVKKGHRVSVYCSSAFSNTEVREYKGVKRVIVPTAPSKSLEKMSNSLLSCLHAAAVPYDIVLLLGVSPVLFAWLLRLFGKQLVINPDGLEWKRQKWSWFGSKFLETCEMLSGYFCQHIVTDSKVLQKYFLNRYHKKSTYIAYGADVGRHEDDGFFEKYGLEKDKYFLQVCRLEPENNTHLVIEEYKHVKTDYPLVILGDAPHTVSYKRQLKQIADPRVRFLGSVYGKGYDILRGNAFCYIHAHEVGGTNPALLEALAAGNCVVALNVSYNREVIGTAGLTFSKKPGSLSSVLKYVLQNPQLIDTFRKKAIQRIQENYTWDFIISEYEKLFLDVIGRNNT